MTPEQIALEATQLSIDDRKRVISLIVDSLVERPVRTQPKRSVLEFEGVGAHTRTTRADGCSGIYQSVT